MTWLKSDKQLSTYNMKRLNSFLSILLILVLFKTTAQQIKFRDVLGNNGYDYGLSAQQIKDKGYIVCGSTTSVGSGNSDIYIIKTDSTGKPVKEKYIGGINVDRGTCIKETTDNGYIILGYTNGSGTGGYDIYVIKTDVDLNISWMKTYGGNDWDFGNCIEQTKDGGYIICGGTYSFGKGDEDYYLIKTDSKGDTLWTKTYGGAGQDEARAVIQTKDGGYALTGFSNSTDTLGNFYTIKTNETGAVTWINEFGKTQLDKANDLLELSSGGYIVGGETKSFGAGKSDGILIGLTPTGTTTGKTFLIGDKENDNVQSITERKDGKIAFAGNTNSYGFNNGKGDIYFGIMNGDWSYFVSTTFGSNGAETVNSVESTMDDGAIICGSTNGFRNFLEDIYLIKTGNDGYSSPKETVILTPIAETEKDLFHFTIYPHPITTTVANLHIATSNHTLTIELYDVTGHLLKKETLRSVAAGSSVPFAIGELAEGFYFIKLITDQTSASKRILVKQ